MNNKAEKQKIGMISFHRAINYGAILQVYALQEKVNELGAECTILDYRNEKLESHHKEMKLSDCKEIKDYIIYFLLHKNYNEKFHAFRNFSYKYLNMSKPYYSAKELEKVEDEYDRFITGSDQVWNFSISNLDPAYFLSFNKGAFKKNSYAASFGVNSLPEKYKDKYYNLLKEFNYLSVREQQGAKIISKLFRKDVQVVLDPTLLISKEEWFKLSKDYFSKNKYILVYAFGGSKNIMDLAKNISKKTGYKVVWISNTYKKSINIKYVKSAGPEEFLGLFKNAEYIITNSFHGTALSINFNKQFFTELLPESKGTNSRMEDILELFKLENRIITSSNSSVIDIPIDYTEVNRILKTERKRSIDFLKCIVINNIDNEV